MGQVTVQTPNRFCNECFFLRIGHSMIKNYRCSYDDKPLKCDYTQVHERSHFEADTIHRVPVPDTCPGKKK